MEMIMGIDWGEERIGLALGDTETLMATPYKTVSNLEEVLAEISNESVDRLVVGRPTKLDGTNDHIDSYRLFCMKLEKANICPVDYCDERLTSKAADALSGCKKTKAGRDELAAMVILQNYLDANKWT